METLASAQRHEILVCLFRFLQATVGQVRSLLTSCLGRGWSPSQDGSCAVGAHASSTDGLPSPAALELTNTETFWSFCAFKLALHFILLLEFSSSRSSVLPDPPECSLCSHRTTWVVLISCQSVKHFCLLFCRLLRELLAKPVTSPVRSCWKCRVFPCYQGFAHLLLRCHQKRDA